VASSLTTTIMAATINEVSSTKSLPANDGGGGGGIIIVTNLPATEELCMYIILR